MLKSLLIPILGIFVFTLINKNSVPNSGYEPKSVFVAKPVEAVAETESPVSFYIPKIGKSAQVIAVGLDETNRTPIPEQNTQVAWYKFGGKLGENGSVVLAGHHFWNNAPGVFGRLKDLRVHDRIEVRGETGKNYVFEVKEIQTYQRTAFPSEKVYFSSDTQRLTLVTCAGRYDTVAGDFDQRLVVYATRVG
ncbi:MAG: class F sortase [Patescibacteria group bacterium]|jgi:LPXTG-site transpeptidase (sortase) family protein